MKHLLTLEQLSKEEILEILNHKRAAVLPRDGLTGLHDLYDSRTLGSSLESYLRLCATYEHTGLQPAEDYHRG